MKSIKKQVSMGVTASLALLLGLSPVTHQAQAYNEFEEIDTSEVELTPEEEALAEEMYDQYLAIEAVVENLDDEQEEIFLNALLDPEFDSSQFDGDVLIAESKKRRRHFG